MGGGRRWGVDLADHSTSASSRDVPDPPGFTRASLDQDDSSLTRQKKDAEANWKAQVSLSFSSVRVFILFLFSFLCMNLFTNPIRVLDFFFLEIQCIIDCFGGWNSGCFPHEFFNFFVMYLGLELNQTAQCF